MAHVNWITLKDGHDPAKIIEEKRDEWVQDAIDYLTANPDESVYYTMCGDSCILAHRDEDSELVTFHDLKIRRSGYITLKHPNWLVKSIFKPWMIGK